jgi:hypothetical protein
LAPQLGFFSFKTWLQEALRALCESVILTLSPQQALLAAMVTTQLISWFTWSAGAAAAAAAMDA